MLSWLFERFLETPQNAAIIWRDESFSYQWMHNRIQDWQKWLQEQHIPSGSVVAIEGDYSPQVVALLLTLIHSGMIIVPLTTTVESRKPRFMEIAEVQYSIRFSGKDDFELIQRELKVDHPLLLGLQKSETPGLVLFSSGSTGDPKAALHDFAKLLEKFKVERHSLRSITFLLLDHIGGINTLLYILSNKGTIIAIEDRSPDFVCEMIEKHAVELLPTSPTFINMLLLSEAYKRHDLRSLKRVTYGTEPMPESTLQRLNEILPDVRLQQTYGLSELGILRSKSRSNDTLWVKVGGEGFETKVVDNILWIKAESAMLGYLNAPSPFDEDGWFNTGDEVLVDGEYLKILGRRSEMINVGGEKVFPAEVESVLMEMENVLDASVRAEKNPITGQMVVARLTLKSPEEARSLKKRVRGFCRGKLAPYKIPAKIEITDQAQHSGRFKKMRKNFNR